jgi:hypothetical protein
MDAGIGRVENLRTQNKTRLGKNEQNWRGRRRRVSDKAQEHTAHRPQVCALFWMWILDECSLEWLYSTGHHEHKLWKRTKLRSSEVGFITRPLGANFDPRFEVGPLGRIGPSILQNSRECYTMG